MHQQATIMLEFRVAEMQARASADQAAASRETSAATKDLAAFTRTLVRATWALFFVGGVTGLLTIVQILMALNVIGR